MVSDVSSYMNPCMAMLGSHALRNFHELVWTPWKQREGSVFFWLLNTDKAECWAVCHWPHTKPRSEGGRSRGKCALGEKRLQAHLLGASVWPRDGACVRQRGWADEGPASSKCEDEHPVVTMMLWPINDAWCMGDGIDVIILQKHIQAKTKPSFLNKNEREMTGEKQNICEMI